MKLPNFCIRTIIALATLGINVQPGFSQTEKGANRPNQVTFFCQQLYDPTSGEKVPMTVVWVPEREAHVRLIAWKSQAFGKNWTPQKRCDVVSSKFQKFYQSGQLNYLTVGRIKTRSQKGNITEKQVICAVQEAQGICDDQNQLFTIKDEEKNNIEKADDVLNSLVDLLYQGGNAGPIWQ
ncbi:hypothetical protein B7O87_13730 [Cylindrospermopsis raciborskii CENA303]|uniref:Uncharacterized protein n=1 Tax=Cylindrospermopsis raciborskii CENA303 TaxID=1170769 RepID=A0A1X4G3T0_9CYAN|nr:COP23 domain-containing protein [Cylindrospermopsis raciborskii]OSO88155.1 hypothetical protein B7O87_13730 [Cylindrospermopsis raciborskii CENA303]